MSHRLLLLDLGIYVNLGVLVININRSVVMKTIDIRIILFGLFFTITFCSCEKKIPPTVETLPITNITGTTAASGGTIIDGGSESVIVKGVCWSRNHNPTIATDKSDDGDGTGTFVSNLIGLNGGTGYYVRAYATNEAGTGYGGELYFTTLGKTPTAITKIANNVAATSVTLNGTVNANDLSTTVSFEYGTTASYGQIANAIQSPLTNSSNTDISVNLEDLSGGTLYHFRVKAVNSLGTAYGDDLTFTTLGQLPTATTQEVTNRGGETATLNGIANANYLTTVVTFEYGLTTDYGNTVTASQSPVTGNSSTTVSAEIQDLKGGTTYHYRIVATNSLGTTNGNDMSFVTKGAAPLVKTLAATKTTPFTAQLNGSVLANDLTTIVTFEYGATTGYGISVTASQSPINGNLSAQVNADALSLTKGAIYHYRIVATNSIGTTYGEDVTFTATYKIGDNMHGGLIFYIDESGEHGLVSTTSDQINGPWGCANVIGAGGRTIGTGMQNTIDIVLSCSSEGYAAKICYDLVLNGYDDWFLPSRDELSLMCSNLYEHNLGGFYGNYYWSSSQYNTGSAYANNFFYNATATRSKSDPIRARAVRAF